MDKKTIVQTIVTLTTLLGGTYASAGSVEHSVQAVDHSVQAIGHGVVGTVKIASGVIALPLALGGEIGTASTKLSESFWDIATTPIGSPLPVAEETFVTLPTPEQAIHLQEQGQ